MPSLLILIRRMNDFYNSISYLYIYMCMYVVFIHVCMGLLSEFVVYDV